MPDTLATVDQKDQNPLTKLKVTTVEKEDIAQVGPKIMVQPKQRSMEYGMVPQLMESICLIRLISLITQTSATPNNKLVLLVNLDFTVVLNKPKNASHAGPATTALVRQEMMLRKLVRQVFTVQEPKSNHIQDCKLITSTHH
jgi:hypothetical protein